MIMDGLISPCRYAISNMHGAMLFSLASVLVMTAAIPLTAEGFLCAGFLRAGIDPLPIEIVAKSAQLSTVGTRSAIVIFANFRGENPGQDQAPSWSERIFDPERPGSFSHFYDTMSFNHLRVRGAVAPRRYESVHKADFYLATASTELGHYGQFALEILEQADTDIDFSHFDNDGPDGIPNSGDDDGLVDALFIIVASTPRNFLLGGATGIAYLNLDDERVEDRNRLEGPSFVTDDSAPNGTLIQIASHLGSLQQGRSFSETVGSMCHEYGHTLGLPDLFNTAFLQSEEPLGPEKDSAGIGAWGLMGWGTLGWNRNDGPNSFSVWSRVQLGWSSVQRLAREHETIELTDTAQGGSAFILSLSKQGNETITRMSSNPAKHTRE